MSSFVQEIESAIARLVEEPAFSAFSKPEAGILVWTVGGDRILWANPVALPLREALLRGGDGFAVLPLSDAARLKYLAGGGAPRQGMQLERLRLNPLRHAAPLTCVCRLIPVVGHGDVLVTAITGPVPLAPKTLPEQRPLSPRKTLPADLQERMRAQGTLRFTWQADPTMRITAVSQTLSEIIGPQALTLIGKTWPEVITDLREQKPGSLLKNLEQRQTWSGEILFWVTEDRHFEVGIELAGMPIFDGARRFSGYRGFGLCRAEQITKLAPAIDQDVTAPTSKTVAALREIGAEITLSEEHPSEHSASDNSALSAPPAQLLKNQGKLTETDKLTLREIAVALGGPISKKREPSFDRSSPGILPLDAKPEASHSPQRVSDAALFDSPKQIGAKAPPSLEALLDSLPAGVLIHRGEQVLFANQPLLAMIGYANIDKLAALGVVGLFKDSPVLAGGNKVDHPFMLTNISGDKIAVDVRLSSLEWKGVPSSLMLIRQSAETGVIEQLRKVEKDNRERGERLRELESILATAADGILTLDETGRILSLNSSGEALFGYETRDVLGEDMTVLLAPESHMIALDYLDSLRLNGVAGLLKGGREVMGRVKQGGMIPLFMTIGQMHEGAHRKLCVVLRDITAFKKAETELLTAKQVAEKASEQKSELLAKISHEIRTPLNAIIGFAELMLEERFGPVGNERYTSYLKDMHTSGTHVMSLVNDLLDLAKIEAGHMELNFTGVALNDLVTSCIAMLQQQAVRDHIVLRTSFAAKLPMVVADERSVRQIVLNLVSNAIKFTDAGGQVIISTAMADDGSIAIRVRDTGIGMDEHDIVAALEPFRQLATARQRGGTGLGLPLTKALVEANRGSFEISSTRNEGTLVEVVFPPTRVLAE